MNTEIILTTLNARYMHCAFALRYLYANLGELQARAQICEFGFQPKFFLYAARQFPCKWPVPIRFLLKRFYYFFHPALVQTDQKSFRCPSIIFPDLCPRWMRRLVRRRL